MLVNRMAGGVTVPPGYPVQVHLDSSTQPTAAQVYTASLAMGHDVRVVYRGETELPRQILTFTPEAIDIWFPLHEELTDSDQESYTLYYGNAAATDPGFVPSDVFVPAKDNDTRLLLYFNAGSGATVSDESGSGNHGSLEGAINWTTGRFHTGLDFKGGVVWMEDSASLRIDGQQLTVEAWFWLDAIENQTYIS